MKEIKFNDNWKFWKDRDAFALVWNIPEQAKDVTLPHDAMLEEKPYAESPNGTSTGFRDGDSYTYVKEYFAKKEDMGKAIFLKFEGVYMNAFVYVNEQLAMNHPYGYTQFYVPLHPYLKYGEKNEIRVQVRNGAMGNSRWYSGSGIYRDVYLLKGNTAYIAEDGLMVTTENAEEDYASLRIDATLQSRANMRQDLILRTSVQDENGNEVSAEETSLCLFEQEKRTISMRLTVADPMLWSDTSPALYKVCSKVYLKKEDSEKELLDENSRTFGIRTLSIDARRGLRVNKKSVKLRGACIHHDSGLLGAATYYDAEYRRVSILKNAGFNAIRMSHHPASEALLAACDRLGMYVMDETFDMWTRSKSTYDYNLYFSDWWERDAEAMAAKDYNHPSVILYSIGNEIPEIGTDFGAKVGQTISRKIKTLDPTRFTLASINGVFAAGDAMGHIMADVGREIAKEGDTSGNVNDFMTVMDKHMDKIVVHDEITKRLDKACAATDIAGYNYMTARYAMDAETRPNRVMVGSETYPPEIAINWTEVMKYPQVIGDFTWTGWDYIGEAGVGIPGYQFGEGGFGAQFPAQLAYTGDIDITGFRRPLSYFREIVWGLRKDPYIAVQNPEHYGEELIKTPWVMSDSISSYTWRGFEGKKMIVEVYGAGDETELLLNGTSLGKMKSGKEAGFRSLFEITYIPGTLEAVSYENGVKTGSYTLQSAEESAQLSAEEVNLESTSFTRPETCEPELIYLSISLQDKNGRVVTDECRTLSIEISGDACLLGFGSADPKPVHNYTENMTDTWNGRAMAVLKKTGSGNAVVCLKSDNKLSSETII